MAHLNCPTCCQGMFVDQWGNLCDSQCTGSNMSLNMAPGSYPMWMGTWHGPPPSAMGMYPYTVGHLHHDMQSRSQSRAPSPTHSMKSRKSITSKKSRRKYVESDDSDDEKDDRRSVRSERKSLGGRYTVRQRPLRDTASMPREVLRRNTLERLDRSSVARSRHSIRATSSESDESPSEDQKESEALLEDEEDSVARENQDTGSTNVPKSTWECEHCTFVNEAGTRVCSICCKTSTAAAVKTVRTSDSKQIKNKAAEKRQLLQKGVSSDDYSKDYSETESVQNKLMKLKVSSNTYEDEKKNSKIEARKKGRTIRKISFWPGTKFTTLQK